MFKGKNFRNYKKCKYSMWLFRIYNFIEIIQKHDFNTCYYLPKAAVKSKQLDTQTQSFLDQMNSYISTRERKTSKSYKVTITDSNGNVLTYDSAAGIVSNENYIKVKIFILFILVLIF